jgi:hypothetical protein
MIIHITAVEVTGPHSLHLTFDDADQSTKAINLYSELEGPVFEPLKDPATFARVWLDPELGTVVWPNGADFAPDFLYRVSEPVAP